jgi:hypothetical protein
VTPTITPGSAAGGIAVAPGAEIEGKLERCVSRLPVDVVRAIDRLVPVGDGR